MARTVRPAAMSLSFAAGQPKGNLDVTTRQMPGTKRAATCWRTIFSATADSPRSTIQPSSAITSTGCSTWACSIAHIGNLRERWNYPEVAKQYRLIEEGGQPVVAASWNDHVTEIADLIDSVRDRPTRSRFRCTAQFQVNLRFPTGKQLSFVAEGPHGLLIWHGGYEPEMGLWDELLAEQMAY